MKIYTRRGDGGETDLFGGARVPKDSLRVDVYGSVDELNAFLGQAMASSEQADVRALLEEVQRALFRMGSRLASVVVRADVEAGASNRVLALDVDARDVGALEAAIDAFEDELAPLRAFVLPGGSAAAAALHVARTVCRRAERLLLRLAREERVGDSWLAYLNRLSDLLFVLARVENGRSGVAEPEWNGRDESASREGDRNESGSG